MPFSKLGILRFGTSAELGQRHFATNALNQRGNTREKVSMEYVFLYISLEPVERSDCEGLEGAVNSSLDERLACRRMTCS